MVQIIKANPSFGTLLAQHLGTAVGDASKGYLERQQKEKQRAGTSTLLQQYGITPDQANIIAQSGIDPKDVLQYGQKFQEQQQKQLESAREAEQGADVINSLRGKVDTTGVPIFSGIKALAAKLPFTQAYQDREQFDTEALWAVDKAFSSINKGTLTDAKIKNFFERLTPNSKLLQGQNNARINALEKLIAHKPPLTESDLNRIEKEVKEQSKGQSSQQSAQILRAKNPKTGQTLISKDGGNTWEKG